MNDGMSNLVDTLGLAEELDTFNTLHKEGILGIPLK